MRKKELEKLNNDLLVKVEKQKLLIEKLNKDLAFEKQQTKTVFVEKIPIVSTSDDLEPSIRPLNSKPSILDNYGTDLLLSRSMDVSGKLIFRLTDNKTPLDMISFEDWYKGLTRENIIGELRYYNPEVFAYLDQLDLASVKSFFRNSLKEYYESEKKTYIDRLNKIVYETYNNVGAKVEKNKKEGE